ncbi:MAG TPA: response regulator [Patescibacteria group bacterium]|nr:response regulator [Patescibacteria group bacterium]
MNKKILLVEDEASIADVFKDQLTLGGFDVEIAPGGAQALQMLKASKYDLMLLDLVMPEVDGLEVLKEIKEKPAEYPQIPTIALTNVTSEDVKKAVEPYNLKGYLLKLSTKPQEMIEAINKALES